MSVFKSLAKRFIVPAISRPEGLRIPFDIETNGLLDTVDKAHCIVAGNLDNDDVHQFGPDQIPAALDHLKRADYLIGHNALSFDLPVLKKLYGWTPAEHTIVVDTRVCAQTILPNLSDIDDQVQAMKGPALGELRGSYSLKAWGSRLDMPKVGTDIEDWSVYTPEMLARCDSDAKLTKLLFHFLQIDGYSASALALEHRVSLICDELQATGAPFDRARAEQLCQHWQAKADALEMQLAQELPNISNFNSRDQICELLESQGWIPEKRTPKTNRPVLKDDTIEELSELFPQYTGLADFMIINRRLGQLTNGAKSWMNNVKDDGRIYGGIIHIGTPHSRAKHLEPNLAQVPNPKKGKRFANECRALFRAA
jgi:DNA polymerase I-like protein with 3'-5' exonuclease and polymerase domains